MAILECSNLTKTFGPKKALSNVNLHLEKGRIVGLLGPNGSGKTTLIKLCNNLLTPTSGTLLIDGTAPGLRTKSLVSYLPDQMYLNDWMKVSDILNFYCDFYKDFSMKKAEAMLENLKIDKKEPLKTLSKGTKEKVQLILVMARDAQLYLLDQGERLGKHIGQFRERYFNPDKRNAQQVFTFKPKDGADDAIHRLIGDICISMKAEDYLQLPDIIADDIPVVLDSAAERQYRQLERDMLLQVDESTIDVGTAVALSNKLLQLCNGAVYDDAGAVVEIHRCKIEAFMELIEALNGQPALVFYNFRHDLIRLEKALEKSGLRVRRLEGPRDEVDWNARQIDVLLAHPASAAYGLNLQDGGNHVIWFGLNWSLELYQQANKRLHRQGQTQKVIVHHLITAGGRDEDVITALQDKGATQDALIESLKARIERVKER
jgi:SNF2 family DNA or RNA helicase